MRSLGGEYVFKIGRASVDLWLDGDTATRARLICQAIRVSDKAGRPVRLVDEVSGATIYRAEVQ